jgi:CheY-like chemotaxis protein
VQLLGGDDIRIESPGRPAGSDQGGPGVTFAFDIPVDVISPAVRDSEPSAGSLLSEIEVRAVGLAPNQPQYRLLIVDDDPTNRQLLRELLSPFGFALREAENGRQALEIWQEFHPHLILMDMRMPVLNGYEATKQIKELAGDNSEIENRNSKIKNPKIVALTASSFEEEKAKILDAGCDDFLRKPFRETELFQMMSRHIGVQFVYETLDAGLSPSDMENRPLTPEMLATLPSEQLTQLAEAIELSDVTWANEIIDDIERSQPELAATLSRLVNNFEYSAIQAAINQLTSPE